MKLRQLVADARGCRADLDDGDALLDALRRAADAVGAREHGTAAVRYVPHGVTTVLFLAESHAMITTWPEHRLALIDILLCNPDMHPEDCLEVLAAHLEPDGVDIQSVERVIDA